MPEVNVLQLDLPARGPDQNHGRVILGIDGPPDAPWYVLPVEVEGYMLDVEVKWPPRMPLGGHVDYPAARVTPWAPRD